MSTFTDEDLASLYREGFSINAIAKQLGWHYERTRQRLLRAGVVFRSNSEGVHLALRPPPLLHRVGLDETIDGVLLGDGYIEKGKTGSRLSLTQRIDRWGWVCQVRDELEAHNIQVSEHHLKARTVKIKGHISHRNEARGIRSRSYVYLTEQQDRWYPSGKKRIPKDVHLTPRVIAHWWCGDGGIGGKGYHARFSTDGFPTEDVDFLLHRLHEKYGWEGHHTKRNRILLSKAKDRESLLEIVTPHVLDCFQYKLQLRTGNKCHVITDDQRLELLDLRRAGWSYGKLMDRFGMSKSGISRICVKAGLSGYTSRKPK